MFNRRKFLSSVAVAAAAAPPMPPGWKPKLHSPKGAEFVDSLRKVRISVEIVQPKAQKLAAPSAPPAASVASVSVAGGIITITWQGGTGPFVVERKDSLNSPWQAITNSTMARSISVPVMGDDAYFRIHDQVPMPLTADVQADGVHLTWVSPEF